MAFDLAQAGVVITARTEGEQEIAKLENQLTTLRAATSRNIEVQGKATVSAGQMRAGMQQLSFQVGDVATQFAAGTPAMMIFAQQGGQVVQALGMMTESAKGLLGFLGGPWGSIIMAAVVALSPFISRLWDTKDAADGAKGALDELIKKRRQERDEATRTARAGTELNTLLSKQDELTRRIASRPKNRLGAPMFSYRDQQELAEVNSKIREGTQAVAAQRAEDAKAVRSSETSTRAVQHHSSTRTSGMRAVRAHTTAIKADTIAVNDNLMAIERLAAGTLNMLLDSMIERRDRLAAMNDNSWLDVLDQAAEAQKQRTQPGIQAMEDWAKSFKGGSFKAIASYADEIGSLGERAFGMWNRAISNTEDALVDFVMTGKLAIGDMARSIIADLARIAIQQAIIKPLTKWLGGLFATGGAFSGGNQVFATGGVFSSGNVVPFARGGVVGGPTMFPMASGRTGLMGEAGPEAIMPLRRLANGRLGVEAAGGGTSVTVNVDASGSSVQGEGGGGAALGKAIGAAVQAELVRQKRPGGLLAA